MTVFICVVTRPFLVFGVFVGLFRVHRRHIFFFDGGHFGQMGPFCAHFSPEGSNRGCWREHDFTPGLAGGICCFLVPRGKGACPGG
jgi:hypothetical protein